MHLKHKILSLAGVAVFAVGLTSPALAADTATTDVSVNVAAGGSIELAFSDLTLSDITIDANQPTFTSTGKATLTVTDTRVGVGGSINLSPTSLTSTAGTIDGSAISVAAAAPAKTASPSGDPDSVATAGSAIGTLDTGMSLFTTDGAGTWTQDLDITVTVQSTAGADTYTGTLTATSAAAPVE